MFQRNNKKIYYALLGALYGLKIERLIWMPCLSVGLSVRLCLCYFVSEIKWFRVTSLKLCVGVLYKGQA